MSRSTEPAYIEDVVAVRETELALLVVVNGEETWIPKSQIKDESEVNEPGDSGTLVIPEWLADDKGIS